MAKYKKIASAWLNDSQSGEGKYLSIVNNTNEPLTIEPGGKFFMNMTPQHIRDENPKVPLFSKSIKIEEDEDGYPPF